jgi:hypothetical protein
VQPVTAGTDTDTALVFASGASDELGPGGQKSGKVKRRWKLFGRSR